MYISKYVKELVSVCVWLVDSGRRIDFFHGEDSVDPSENKSLYIPEDWDHVHTLKQENALTATGNVTHTQSPEGC